MTTAERLSISNCSRVSRNLHLLQSAFLVLAFCLSALTSPAQTFTNLVSFTGSDGDFPGVGGALVQGLDGDFYGTTSSGATGGAGTVFKITANGALTTLHSFCSETHCADGKFPNAGLVLATDGNFYGSTDEGGANGAGTVFKITSSGGLTTLYNFCPLANCRDGASPNGGLVEATNGDFYGTTLSGGAHGRGTVFQITPKGVLTTIYSFCSQTNCSDGYSPSSLIQATNNELYGTTASGGKGCPETGCGTAFSITTTGNLTTLYTFCQLPGCTDGSAPSGGLYQATNGNFYGTTMSGGASNFGSVFQMLPSGVLTTMHSFCAQNGCPDGSSPLAGLVQATDGNFYGTTNVNGPDGGGTLFQITSVGSLTTLYNFCSEANCIDGEFPQALLLQATDGNFFATTRNGGTGTVCAHGCGTIFSLSTGLHPFVTSLPTAGKVGAKVTIQGNNLASATAVSFDGAAATFTIVSGGEITTSVPANATTGKVEVTTSAGVLKSNIAFRVEK